MSLKHLLCASAALSLTVGCQTLDGLVGGADGEDGRDGGTQLAQPRYHAELLRLSYGVPRIIADDYAGLGYGTGVAAAQDNLCLIMDRAMTVRAERAAFLGAGTNNANIASDIYHQRILDDGRLEALLTAPASDLDAPSEDARAFIAGFTAGVNRVVRQSGTQDPSCAGQPWVRELSSDDIWLGALTLPFGQPINQVTGAAPPAQEGAATTIEARVEDLLVERRGMGSNAYAIGSEGTRSDVRSVLLGNPHYPWDGALRFYRVGMTIPGELNVVGAGLVTTPFVGLGHTDSIAWTHTVSTARRFGYFELELDPVDPTRYRVGDSYRDMTQRDITVQVRSDDGTLSPVTRTLYETEFGPVAVSNRLGWSEETAYAFFAPSSGLRIIDQYFALYQSDTVEEMHAALSRYQAAAFNTMAIDAEGGAYYGDMGMVPNVDSELIARCAVSPVAQGYWAQARVPVLNAADPTCRPRSDGDASAPGIMPPSEAPHLFRDDFVAQSNDSPWLTNPAVPLTGYSPIYGDVETPRSLRTRLALDQMAQRLAGTDGHGEPGFDLDTVQSVMYSNRHHGGELLRDDLVAVCRVDGGEALLSICDALAGWDLKVNLDSTGAHTMALYLLAGGAVFEDAFDVENGATTPVRLDADNPAVLEALQAAAGQLQALQLAPDAALGDVMVEMRGDEAVPIHGGPAGTGVFNMIIPTDPVPGRGWTSVQHGSSWIFTVQFGPDGVRSEGLLSYSQSTDPSSAHFGDQTRLYSQKGWDRLNLDVEEARAAAVEVTILEE